MFCDIVAGLGVATIFAPRPVVIVAPLATSAIHDTVDGRPADERRPRIAARAFAPARYEL
jgi:hypothetical protein